MQRWAEVRIRFADEDEEKVLKPRIHPLDRDAKLMVLCLCVVIIAQAALIMSSKPPAWWLWLGLIAVITWLGVEIWQD